MPEESDANARELGRFNAIEWLQRVMPQIDTVNYATFEPLFSFLLIWNLFERIVCNRSAHLKHIIKHVEDACDQQRVNRSDFDCFLRFFRRRYTEEYPIEQLKEMLLSSDTKAECERLQVLRTVLLGQETSLCQILQSLLFIAYRVRNNLFHGEKELHSLDRQLSLFAAVNAMLCRYMELTEADKVRNLRVSAAAIDNARR